MVKRNRSRAYEVRDRVSMERGLQILDLEADRQGKMLCPMHDDTRPSVKVYLDHWWCYTCDEGGSVIDLVMAVRRVSLEEALTYLEKVAGLKKKTGAIGLASSIKMGRAEVSSRRVVSSDLIDGCLDGVVLAIGWTTRIPDLSIAGAMYGPVDYAYDLVDEAVVEVKRSGDVGWLESEVGRAVSFVEGYLGDVLRRSGMSDRWWVAEMRCLVEDLDRLGA